MTSQAPRLSKHLDFLTNLQTRLWEAPKKQTYITAHEIRIIMELVDMLDLGVQLHNACMGFGIGISFFIDKTRVLQITQHHLGEGIRFDDAWPLFLQIAKRFEYKLIEPLREKSYYEY